jgi:hypothetical protein
MSRDSEALVLCVQFHTSRTVLSERVVEESSVHAQEIFKYRVLSHSALTGAWRPTRPQNFCGALSLTLSLSLRHIMETLDNTHWDVVIAGTGLQQSLLAL